MRRRVPTSDPEALLSGRLDPDDAPPELKGIAALVRAARAPATARELAGEVHLVAAIAAEMRRSGPVGVVVDSRRRRLIGQALSAKVIAATAAVLLSGGVAAAAATGSLPASLQRAVSHGLAHVGISVPAPEVHRSPLLHGGSAKSISTARSNGHRTNSSVTATIRHGLCTAYLHPNESTSAISAGAKSGATSFARLAAAAHASGETITQYCQGVAPSSTSGSSHGSTHQPAASTAAARRGRGSGKASANAHGHPSKVTPTKARHTSTTSAGEIPGHGSTNSSPKSATTHPTTPGMARGSGQSKSATTSTSTTTTTLAPASPGPNSTSRNAGKGASAAHSH